jgi:hypothetical protein
MLTEERTISRSITRPQSDLNHPTRAPEEVRPEFSVPNLLGRLLVVAGGFGVAFTGWMLMMSVILVFIGLPMFIFGLAMMQTQQR